MESTVHSTLRRTLTAGSVALAALALTPATAATGQAAAGSEVTYARAADGQMVAVSTARPSTPVHPEAITHPQLDFMGSSIPANLKSAAGTAARAVSPAASVPQLPGIDVS